MVDSESEMSESNDESNGESENDDVSTDKEKGSKPHNPYIEYYKNHAQTCQRYPSEKTCPNCDLKYTT